MGFIVHSEHDYVNGCGGENQFENKIDQFVDCHYQTHDRTNC